MNLICKLCLIEYLVVMIIAIILSFLGDKVEVK